MKKILFYAGLLFLGLCCTTFSSAQGTLEMTRNGLPTNNGFGTSTSPMTVTFFNDAANNSTFTANAPALTLTISFRNQVFQSLSYGDVLQNTNQTTGLVFGAGPSLAGDPPPQGAVAYNRYNIIGQYGGNGGPTNAMFTSSSSATPTPPGTSPSGTGIRVAGSNATTNGAFEVFTTAQALYGSANGIGSRVYFGDIVLTFNRPVKNPVIHVAGMGGAYRFLPVGQVDLPANYRNIFFASELELVNTGITSTLMSGNEYIQLSGNNILNNNNSDPNAGSALDPFETPFNNLGASTGSVRLDGTVQEVVYRVYLKSGTSSSTGYPWSALGFSSLGVQLITGAQRDPFTGDIWYIAASMDKPTQQVSGSVYYDQNGTIGNIYNTDANNTGALPATYGKTTAGNLLFAYLINSDGTVAQKVQLASDGSYLFDNVTPTSGANPSYTVRITSISTALPGDPAPGTILPAPSVNTQWVYTGEQIALDPVSGGPDGISAPFTVASGEIKPEVNFGINLISNVPAHIISFNGSLQNNIAKLRWVTTNEVNLQDYILERSIDGANFSPVASVTARNLTSDQTYTQDDAVNGLSKMYYRLKITDRNGSIAYSDIVILKQAGIKIGKIFPNAFTDAVRVEIETRQAENATIKITDAAGKQVSILQRRLQAGGNQFFINGLGKLPAGTYTIEVTTSTEKITEKIVKAN